MPTPRQIKPPGPPSPQASRPTGDPVVGAASSRPDRTGGTVGLPVNGTRPWRHEGMPPYGVQRGHGGKWGSFRAAASRPYGARLTWTVGRGAHTPPNQPAGTAKPTSIAPHRRSCRRGGLCGRLEPGPGRRKTAARSRRRGFYMVSRRAGVGLILRPRSGRSRRHSGDRPPQRRRRPPRRGRRRRCAPGGSSAEWLPRGSWA